jgi:hypothetical protein
MQKTDLNEDETQIAIVKYFFTETAKVSTYPLHQQQALFIDLAITIYNRGKEAGYRQRDAEKIIDSLDKEQ